MKKVLCYGDSNTFGFNPLNGSRYDAQTRWSALLKSEYNIIEEGCNDRTAACDNPAGTLFSAQKHFPAILSKLKDIDILILSIGTNDLQEQYNADFDTIEKGLENLILAAKHIPRIILVPSVILNEDVLMGYFSTRFGKTSIAKSKEAGQIYKNLSQKYDLEIFDFNEFVKPSSIDGLHYDELSHKIIAEKLAEFIRKEV